MSFQGAVLELPGGRFVLVRRTGAAIHVCATLPGRPEVFAVVGPYAAGRVVPLSPTTFMTVDLTRQPPVAAFDCEEAFAVRFLEDPAAGGPG